jgi:hypothetical protein
VELIQLTRSPDDLTQRPRAANILTVVKES